MDEKISLLLVEDDPLACGKMAAALTSAANNFAIVGVTKQLYAGNAVHTGIFSRRRCFRHKSRREE